MKTTKSAALLTFVAALMVTAVSHVEAAADELLKLVPENWPLVVRYDGSAVNASGAYIHKVMDSKPELKNLDKAADLGLAKLLASVGFDIDVEKGVLPWMGEQAVIASDPFAKPAPVMLVAFSCRDSQLAQDCLTRLLGSVIRDSDPIYEKIEGATLTTWAISSSKTRFAYAIGEGYVVFGDGPERVKASVAARSANKGPAVAERLALHKDDLFAFAMDVSPAIQSGTDSKEKKRSALDYASMLDGTSMHGGLGVNDTGVVMTIESSVPQALMTMSGLSGDVLAKMNGKDATDALPGNSLAAINTSAGALLEILKGQYGAAAKVREDLGAGLMFLASMGTSPAAFSLTSIFPQPNYAIVVKTDSPSEAKAVLSRFREALQKNKVTAPALESGDDFQIKLAGKKTMGFLGQKGPVAYFASDYRSAQSVAKVTPASSLAARPSYADATSLVGGSRLLNFWMGLEGISALGYFYEAMGANDLTYSRELADALKGTDGMAASIGFTESGASLKMSLRSKVGYGSSILAVYGTIIATALGAAVLEPVFDKAQVKAEAATSQSKLRQLHLALELYADSNNQMLPTSANWKSKIKQHLGESDALNCPFEGVEYQFNPRLSGLSKKSILNPSAVVVFFESSSGPKYGTYAAARDGKTRVVFLDGRVKEYTGVPPASTLVPKVKQQTPVKPVKKPAKKPAVRK